jgi:hypothetical protein
MSWRMHKSLTATARRIFREMGDQVKVRTNGRIFLLPKSPWGKLVILPIDGGHLVAVESPDSPPLAPENVPTSLAAEMAAKGLHPWRLVAANNCHEVICSLVGHKQPGNQDLWSPYLVPWRQASPLIGENRIRLAERLAALLKSYNSNGPLLNIFGPDGIGKQTIISTVVEQLGLTPAGELPLSRLLLDRVFHNSVEMVVDTLLVGNEMLCHDHLLIISEAQLLNSLDLALRDHVLLRELRRLPARLILVSTLPLLNRGVLSLACPGLDDIDEVQRLVAITYPEVRFAGPALRLLLMASADTKDNSIVPGRVLYLIALAKAMLARQTVGNNMPEEAVRQDPDTHASEKHSQELWLAPDEISAAVGLVRDAWIDEYHNKF